MGFPRHKRVVDGFARCLRCRVDPSIAGRGLSSLWDHWKGVEHTRLEQKCRIMTHKPLLDKSCRAVSAEEDRRIRRERMSEPPVYLESELNLTVDERIAIEEAEEAEGQRPQLAAGNVNYLWLSNFINSFVNVVSFGAVLRLVASWRDCMAAELRFECRTLTYPQCQVCILFSAVIFVFNILLVICVFISSYHVVVVTTQFSVFVFSLFILFLFLAHDVYVWLYWVHFCFAELGVVWTIPVRCGTAGLAHRDQYMCRCQCVSLWFSMAL